MPSINPQRAGPISQNELWNSTGGQGWVKTQSLIDRTFKPFEDLLVDAVLSASPRSVLDVGCGTGATTTAIARRLGPDKRCVGIDISETMIAAARARADGHGIAVSFICSDAETYLFDPASFEMIVSRFGVMFFSDSIQAMSNLRSTATNGAHLRCIAWRSPEENPFMTTAEKAAEPLMPGVSKRSPHEAGQFGFADRDRVHHILTKSGWREIDIAPIDVPCAFPVSELELYVSNLGPVGRALQSVEDAKKTKVLEATVPAFDRYRHGAEVQFNAACWIIDARAGA